MPRAGGTYTLPAGSEAVNGETIEPATFNAIMNDLESDANTARPVTVGGTGASTAAGARTNLGLNGAIHDDTGTQRATITSTTAVWTVPLYIPVGTEAAPGLAFAGDTDTGMYRPSADNIGFSCGGSIVLRLAPGALTASAPIRFADGTAAAPAIQSNAHRDTGMYWVAGDIAFSVDASQVMKLASGEITLSVPLQMASSSNGNASAPGVSIAGDTDTGFYLPSPDNIGMSCGGNLVLRVGPSAITASQQILAPTGTADAPGFAFSGHPDTGAFLVGGSARYAVAVGGVISLDVRPDWFIAPGPGAQTTANAANLHYGAGGVFQKSTSSLEFKRDVEPVDIRYSLAALEAEPIYHRSTAELDNADWSYWGFAAEQVAEVDPRLVHWKDGKPRSVQYDRFVVHHNLLIKHILERLDGVSAPDQSDRVTQLENDIAQLKAMLATFTEAEDERV